jgi:hypothetical protein
MWTCDMIAYMYIVPSYNIVVVLMAPLPQFFKIATCNYNATLENFKHD